MQLDREDSVPPGSTLAPQAIAPPPLSTPAAWFADTAPAVPVTVKKRRTLDLALAGPGSDTPDAAQAAADERRPRVFVLPRDPDAPEAGPAAEAEPSAAAAEPGTATETPPLRRRRRRLPEHRPSPVVHIVLPRPEQPAPEDAAAAEADDGFVLELPALDAWRDLQSALAGVRRLVQDAEHASRWGLAPAARARRSRRGG